MARLFWLSDEAWALIDPHLPRGRPGKPRVDDRRVISGILHVLKTGCRWRDTPPEHGPATTVYNPLQQVVAARALGAPVRARRGIGRRAGRIRPRQQPREGAPLGGGRKRGEWAQAVGRSRGGRTSKAHLLADGRGRPVAFALTPGNVADIGMAVPLLEAVARPRRLIADKAYDVDGLRRWLEARRIEAVIPSTATRTVPYPLDRRAYARRNVVEIDHPIRLKASQPRCAYTLAKPRCRAIQAATLGPDHAPPSSGGVPSRSESAASAASGSRLAARPPVPPPVAERLGAEGVAARGQLLRPARRAGQHPGHVQHPPPPRQQPDRPEVPRLGRIPRPGTAPPKPPSRCSTSRAMAGSYAAAVATPRQLPPLGK